MPDASDYKIIITPEAFSNLDRLDKFLRDVNPFAADKSADTIWAAINDLPNNPNFGRKWRFAQGENIRERDVPFGKRSYVIRYRFNEPEIVIIRIFHSLEDRKPQQ